MDKEVKLPAEVIKTLEEIAASLGTSPQNVINVVSDIALTSYNKNKVLSMLVIKKYWREFKC